MSSDSTFCVTIANMIENSQTLDRRSVPSVRYTSKQSTIPEAILSMIRFCLSTTHLTGPENSYNPDSIERMYTSAGSEEYLEGVLERMIECESEISHYFTTSSTCTQIDMSDDIPHNAMQLTITNWSYEGEDDEVMIVNSFDVSDSERIVQAA